MRTLIIVVLTIACSAFLASTAVAQKLWTGTGGDGLWATASNWNGGTVPVNTDSVLLDNSTVSGSYEVTLPGGTVNTVITKLRIAPSVSNTITLTLPATNTNSPGFTVGDSTSAGNMFDIVLHAGGILKNSSGAASGNPLTFRSSSQDSMQILNGGRYVHNTGRGNTGIISQTAKVPGTEDGTFEFDVPGTSSYGISLSGRVYGNLVLSATSQPRTYLGSGTSPVYIRGNLIVNAGVTFSQSQTGAMTIFGNITNNGTIVFAPASSVIFTGTSSQTISGNQILFKQVTINNAAGVVLNTNVRDSILTLTTGNITLGSNNLTIIPGGTINGGSSTSHMVTNGTGGVVRTIAASGSAQYPIAADQASYNPLTVALGSSDVTDSLTVNVASGVSPSLPNDNTAVQQTWTITEGTPGGTNATLTFQWAGAQEGAAFARASGAAWRHDGSIWNQVSAGTISGTDPYSFSTTTAVTNFSPFVIANGVAAAWFSTKSLAFGDVNVGLTSASNVVVKNTGLGTLNITLVTASDTVFKISPENASIPASDSTTFSITFAPTAAGPKSAIIVFASNTPAGYDTVSATGNGVEAGFLVVPTSILFGDVVKDSSKTDSVTVTNVSNAVQLVIDSVRSDNPVFSVLPTNAILDTLATRKFGITFQPTAAGPQSGNIVFFHNGPTRQDTVTVSGNGIVREPQFTVTPTSLSFPSVLVGESKRDTLKVRNTGTDSLFITGVISTDPQFAITPTAARLDTADTSLFIVTYTPTVSAPVSAYIVFTHNGTKALDTVSVTGGGAVIPMTMAEARKDTNHDFQPDRLGQVVTVVGIVNSVNIQTVNYGYYIQDSTGGLQVFQYSTTGPPYLRPGYRVQVTGAIAQYRGTTEIMPASVATDVVVLDTGNVVTAIPLTIGQYKANGELYENRRIRLTVVAPMFTSASWPVAGASANLNIWDGQDTLVLRLDSDTEVPGSPFPTFPVTLYGTGTQFTSSSSVYNDGYQITPMFASDFVPVNAPPVARFQLLAPANNSTVFLDDTAQVVPFVWRSALDFNPDTLVYHWIPVGWTAVLTGNNGRDTSLSLTGKGLLPYLGAADSLQLKWTADVSDGVNPVVACRDTSTVLLVRRNITSVGDNRSVPQTFVLDQNYPNPFNPSTTVQYGLPQTSHVVLKVYSILGEEVATLVDGIQEARYYRVIWNGTASTGRPVASGIYFYRLSAKPLGEVASPFVQVRKMVLMK